MLLRGYFANPFHPRPSNRNYVSGVTDSAVAPVIWLARITIAAVFALAAVAKFRDPEASLAGATDLGVPAPAAPLVARAVPALEGLAAALILLPATSAVGAVLGLVLLAVFTVAVVRVLRSGRVPMCFCFGNQRAAPAGTDTVVRNVALGAMCVVVVLGGR